MVRYANLTRFDARSVSNKNVFRFFVGPPSHGMPDPRLRQALRNGAISPPQKKIFGSQQKMKRVSRLSSQPGRFKVVAGFRFFVRRFCKSACGVVRKQERVCAQIFTRSFHPISK